MRRTSSSAATPSEARTRQISLLRYVVAPTVSTEDAQAKFSNVEVVKPYLRFADAPNA